jgi:hypothetical protein
LSFAGIVVGYFRGWVDDVFWLFGFSWHLLAISVADVSSDCIRIIVPRTFVCHRNHDGCLLSSISIAAVGVVF